MEWNFAAFLIKFKKIVIKIGSNTLAKKDGTINVEFMEKFASECGALMKQGKQLIVVSSGAQVAGLSTIEGWAHKGDIHYRQALASIGQVELMHKWRCAFKKESLHVAQLLLTKDDFEDKHRTLNIRNTLFTLVDENVIPIINENDSIATDEFYKLYLSDKQNPTYKNILKYYHLLEDLKHLALHLRLYNNY